MSTQELNEEWWERPVCWICDYWWIILLATVIGLTIYFTRKQWSPLLGMELKGTPTVLGTGDVQITLTWSSTNDLDLWVTDPNGETIYYKHPTSVSGGNLDVDANANCNQLTDHPVENIFWPRGRAPRGTFQVEVQYYKQCEANAPITYRVEVLVDGKKSEYSNLIQNQGERQPVTTIHR